MVKELTGTPLQYQCEECGFVYGEKKWAEKCEDWCREHHSCNLGIIQHAVQES